MSRLLEGMAALVTGGGTGIGKGITRRLLEEGAAVTIAGRRVDVLEAAVSQLTAEIPGAVIAQTPCDVTKTADVARAVEVAAGAAGRLDIAIANAGGAGAPPAPFLELGEEAWRAALDVNVVGTANTFREAARAMLEHGGAMVAISSEVAVQPALGLGHYSAAKAAVDNLVRLAANELAPKIRVNAIRPGLVREAGGTAETIGPDDGLAGQIIDGMLVGRLGTPRDIADAVLHLVGPTGTWITGQAISVDGGFTARYGADVRPLLGARR